MKTNKIVLEEKYKTKTILFKVIPYKSYKSPIHQNTQMNFNSTFDFNNNEMIPDTYEDYILNMHNEYYNNNSINNY